MLTPDEVQASRPNPRDSLHQPSLRRRVVARASRYAERSDMCAKVRLSAVFTSWQYFDLKRDGFRENFNQNLTTADA